jgi:hypothetical protein
VRTFGAGGHGGIARDMRVAGSGAPGRPHCDRPDRSAPGAVAVFAAALVAQFACSWLGAVLVVITSWPICLVTLAEELMQPSVHRSLASRTAPKAWRIVATHVGEPSLPMSPRILSSQYLRWKWNTPVHRSRSAASGELAGARYRRPG